MLRDLNWISCHVCVCVSGCPGSDVLASTATGREVWTGSGCEAPGSTPDTRSSWHQFCHLISLFLYIFLTFLFFFFWCQACACAFIYFCILDTIPRRGLTTRVSFGPSMPFSPEEWVSALSQSPAFDKSPGPARLGRGSSSSFHHPTSRGHGVRLSSRRHPIKVYVS